MKAILPFILFFFAIHLNAEILPMSTIVELSVYSDKVLEAKFLKSNDQEYLFLTKEIQAKGSFTDTLRLNYLERMYNKPDEDWAYFDNCEQLIIYLYNGDREGEENIAVGFRLLKDGKIFFPFQPTNPGNYSFTAMRETIDWEVYKKRIIKVDQRIRKIKALKKIADPVEQNEKLFAWIKRFKNTFGKACDWDADCGWGSLEWDVFKWIANNNIAKDTWDASQLFRVVNAESEIDWRRRNNILRQDRGNAFKTYEDIDFLLDIATDKDRSIDERRQALIFLTPAIQKVYEDNDPVLDSTLLAFQIEKQKNLRQAVFELMDKPDLRSDAFLLVKRLTNPLSHGQLHRTDRGHLPQIIAHYTQLVSTLAADTSMSEPNYYGAHAYKNDLARFIAKNSSAEKWHEITSCDANIFMELKQVYIHPRRNTLSFSIYYNYGKEVINKMPTVFFTPITEDGKDATSKTFERELVNIENQKFDLPWTYGNRYLRLDLKALKLKKGNYRCHVEGRAGEQEEYFWKSTTSHIISIVD